MGRTEAKQRIAVPVLAAALALALGGCLGSESDKAGGAQHRKPVVLTMANGNGLPLELEAFAAAVARLSNKTVRIEFKNNWRQGSPSYETEVIGDVEAGKADLGWAGSRAFDSVGVPTFDALHAPLLIDSYALEQRVLQSPLVDDMLDGLKPLGVIGLGVLPGPLKKPLGVSPLIRPEDYRGKTLGISRSRVARQTLRALGASAKDVPSGGKIDGLDGVEQQVSGIEGNHYDDVAKNITANVNLWPRPQVLFMNKKAFAALSDTQRDALRAAAHHALPATMAYDRKEERDETAILCRRKPTFLTASDSDLAALRRAVMPVYDRLERDAVTKSAIEQIRTMRSGAPSTPDAPRCSNARSTTSPAGKATPIDGVYRMTTTRKESLKIHGADPGGGLSENYGRWRFVLDRGRVYYTQASEGKSRWTKAVYTVLGHTMTWRITDSGGQGPSGAKERIGEVYAWGWSRYRDQLTLTPVAGKISPPGFRVKPWRRIGDAR
jgi:TRAP-type C4-dicarboxylate transport system substrate-binding protein